VPLPQEPRDVADARARRHLRFGWWSLALFLSFGIVLEGLHGFKVRAYLDVGNETRRLMWTLAHAHGTLLSLVHIAWAGTLRMLPSATRTGAISACLFAATALLPGGFFLGGVVIHAGDPGLGIVFVPAGALLLLCGVVLIARRVGE
jgi:hypothetical protein